MDARDRFIEQAYERLAQWREDIKRLKVVLSPKSEQGQLELFDAVAVLNEYEQSARNLLQKLEQSNEPSWEQVKAEFEEKEEGFEKSLKRAFDKIPSGMY